MRFDPEKEYTYAETYGVAMETTDPEEAKQLFDELVAYSVAKGEVDIEKTAERLKSSLGYYAGYYGRDVQERVEKLYGGIHPIFGSTNGPQMTTVEIFNKGVEMGKALREES